MFGPRKLRVCVSSRQREGGKLPLFLWGLTPVYTVCVYTDLSFVASIHWPVFSAKETVKKSLAQCKNSVLVNRRCCLCGCVCTSPSACPHRPQAALHTLHRPLARPHVFPALKSVQFSMFDAMFYVPVSRLSSVSSQVLLPHWCPCLPAPPARPRQRAEGRAAADRKNSQLAELCGVENGCPGS